VRIGALAGQTGISQRLLRYYEEQGLLRPSRLANGYREYDESDVVTVSHIRDLLAAGLPTAVIAQVLPCVHRDDGQLIPSPCPGMVSHLGRERARLADAINELQTARQALDNLLAAMPDRQGGPERVPDAEPGAQTLTQKASRLRSPHH
jgi:DNA-binding transcriptional MerR regulator